MSKTTFISNYFNHHQKPFSDEMGRLGEYTFIQTEEMDADRKNLGWGEQLPDYVEENYNCGPFDMTADAYIAGSAPEEMVQSIIKAGKLLFRYSERPLKNGNNLIKYFPRLVRWHMRNPVSKPVYMLCASAFTALDYSRFFLFRNRTYKWGYFPRTKVYDSIDRLIEAKNKTEILWCGRFIDWKHPDDAIRIAHRLQESGCDFTLKFVGTDEMEQQLKDMVSRLNLEDKVVFTGPLSPEKVRENMEKAGIYLFTSDRQEGWGAVLNESMNSGCAVVASHLIGSVPFLVKDNENGMVYRWGDVDMLYKKVKYLLDNPAQQARLGRAAYKTITDEWNAQVAAERFINLARHILSGDKYPDLYKNGPCSKAEIIKEDWF